MNYNNYWMNNNGSENIHQGFEMPGNYYSSLLNEANQKMPSNYYSALLNESNQRVFNQFLNEFFINKNKKSLKKNKDLLTDEEKRSNHIASEQKRRMMIKSGFKDLTEIVPTLRNINKSKSTVLFKAVDYIRYLEKRNKILRDKIKHLQVRAHTGNSMDHFYLLQQQQQQQQQVWDTTAVATAADEFHFDTSKTTVSV